MYLPFMCIAVSWTDLSCKKNQVDQIKRLVSGRTTQIQKAGPSSPPPPLPSQTELSIHHPEPTPHTRDCHNATCGRVRPDRDHGCASIRISRCRNSPNTALWPPNPSSSGA